MRFKVKSSIIQKAAVIAATALCVSGFAANPAWKYSTLLITVDSIKAKVGIGTTSASNRLTVVGSVKADTGIFNTIVTSPKIGIGETSPSHSLTISGNSVNGIVWGERIRNTDNAISSPYSSGAGIMFTLNEYPSVSKVSGIAMVSENQYGNSNGLRFFTGNDVTTPKMAILGGGNVGIGTTNPGYPLTVKTSAGSFFVNSYGSASTKIQSSGTLGYDIPAGATHEFLVNGSLKMIMDGNGRVGIGTTNPQSLLAVNGTITTKEVVVTATGWPDYVFKKDYDLKPLNEVEKFINTHKHLEGIPTEKEVQAKGVAMGDMQTKLLKKVEELTMYAIAEDKKIDAQNRKIEVLIKANEELSRRLDQDK